MPVITDKTKGFPGKIKLASLSSLLERLLADRKFVSLNPNITKLILLDPEQDLSPQMLPFILSQLEVTLDKTIAQISTQVKRPETTCTHTHTILYDLLITTTIINN